MRKLILFVALTTFPSLYAGVVYNNGGPNGANGNEMTQWIQAEDFVLGASTTLTGVTFWDFEAANAYQGSIFWQIYSNNGSVPGAVLFSGSATPVRTLDPAANFGDWTGMRNDFSVGSLALAGGTTYWLGLHNGALATDTRVQFYWATTNANATATGEEDISPFGTGGWFNNGQEHAFNLSGDGTAIPEPATLLLLGPAVCVLALLRRRRAN